MDLCALASLIFECNNVHVATRTNILSVGDRLIIENSLVKMKWGLPTVQLLWTVSAEDLGPLYFLFCFFFLVCSLHCPFL